MRQNIYQTTAYASEDNSQTIPTYQDTIYQCGNSQVAEPEIINPINSQVNALPVKSGMNSEDIQNSLLQETGNADTRNPKAEPSATTDETKAYVGGGTTPDSNILINKPKRNYVVYGVFGVFGVVGAYVIYKVFFNKK